jgi:serine/threonine-protein kinase HipA
MTVLYVYMNGLAVGEYIQYKNGIQEFIYSDSWLEHGEKAVPLSLSLPLTDKKHKGEVVYNYFENLLPDSMDIRKRIQARFGVKTDRPFDLLSYIGKDCVGAIQLITERTEIDIKKITGTPLNENEIAEELRNYESLPLGMSKDRDFRISLAGAQEKTALLWHEGKWQRPAGPTPTTHIFKLPIGKIEHSRIDLSESVENEWLCMEVLRAFNLPVPNVRLEKFEDVKVLVVERFDRD